MRQARNNAGVRLCNPTNSTVYIAAGTTVGWATDADGIRTTHSSIGAIAATGSGRNDAGAVASDVSNADDVERAVRDVQYGVCGERCTLLEQHVRKFADVYSYRT